MNIGSSLSFGFFMTGLTVAGVAFMISPCVFLCILVALATMGFLGHSIPALGRHISHVVCMSAEKQVLNIHAYGIIAFVAN